MLNRTIHSLIKPLFNPLVKANNFRFGQSVLSLKRQKQARLAKKLKQKLEPTYLEVTDITLGGASCGQMYKIIIESPFFEGKSKVAQHQLVSQCLGEDLNNIHAFNLKTKVPKKAQQQKIAQKQLQRSQKKQQ